jgi:hypothetical protein
VSLREKLLIGPGFLLRRGSIYSWAVLGVRIGLKSDSCWIEARKDRKTVPLRPLCSDRVLHYGQWVRGKYLVFYACGWADGTS